MTCLNEVSNLARQCPRFDRCSVNNCPLDPRYPNRRVVQWKSVSGYASQPPRPARIGCLA